MLPTNTTTTMSNIQDSYLDPNALNSVKLMGKEKDPQAFKEVAKKFEAMFLQQMLKTMRDASEVFADGDMFQSDTTRFHQDMLDQQLVLNLTSGKGIGLAEQFYRQMMQLHGPDLNREKQEKPEVSAKKDAVSDTQENFVFMIKPHAQQAAKALNIDPDVLVAQVALETGWGKHVIHNKEGKNTFNLFNIKANKDWEGEKVSVPTVEYDNGIAKKENADFRQYQSYAESFSDYVNLIKNNPRYESVLAAKNNAIAYADSLSKTGYATDPEYAEKIKRLLQDDLIKGSDNFIKGAL
jgi:peptidoglycan hydrolase FlgJ